MAFLGMGEEVLAGVIKDCEGLGKSEGKPRMEGRYMRIMLTPLPQGQGKNASKPEKNSGGQAAEGKNGAKQKEAEKVPAAIVEE